jgi:hypothetical protein
MRLAPVTDLLRRIEAAAPPPYRAELEYETVWHGGPGLTSVGRE